MAKSDEHILRLHTQRKQEMAPAQTRMREVAAVYRGDKQVDLPELGRNEKSAVPNLVAQGLDQMAMRIASTRPMPDFPSLKPGNEKSDRYAAVRRDVTIGWWEANKLTLQGRHRSRYYLGFGSSPVYIRYDRKRDIPVWELRSPMETYPSPSSDVDSITPNNVIFCNRKPFWWLLQNYPEKIAHLYVGQQAKPDDLFELVEYVDEECRKLIVLGKTDYTFNYTPDRYGAAKHVTLEESYHELGMCPVVIPGRISLDRVQGAFDTVLGMYERQARMMALEEIAIERGIFADPWLEPLDANVTPQIVTPADGREGIVGVVRGGRMNYERVDASFTALQAVDRYERAIRTTAGVPAEWGGESGSNIRTGRRGDAIMSATIDFHVQEAQELFAESRREEDRRAIALDRKFGGMRAKTIAVGWRGAKGVKTYVPAKHWETDVHAVRYAMAGADATQLNIQVAQKIGTGIMSVDTGRELDPLIDDPEMERRRVITQRLDEAGLTAIEQQAAAGTIPIGDLAAIKKKVLTGTAWEDAVEQVQREAQERQATEVAPEDPMAQPGLAMPGMGAEAMTSIPEPTPSVENLAAVFSASRRPSMTIPAEGAAA